jgi:hypothetical protein
VLEIQEVLREQLESALSKGLQIIDFDADSRTYQLAELPSWFPEPAEGGAAASD